MIRTVLGTGSILRGFRVERMIGRGRMAVVFEATQLSLERPVALKLLADELCSDPGFVQHFRRAARLQASLEHPHVLTVYEAGESEHGLYLAMRLVRGPTLAELLADGALDAERALHLLTHVAQALDAAHAVGLVHCDVRPENVFVAEGNHAYLADFGLTTQPATVEADRDAFAQMVFTCVGRHLGGENLDAVLAASVADDSPSRTRSPTALVRAVREALGVPEAGSATGTIVIPHHPPARSSPRFRLLTAAAAAAGIAAIGLALVFNGNGDTRSDEVPEPAGTEAGRTPPGVAIGGGGNPLKPAPRATAGSPRRELAEFPIVTRSGPRRLAVVTTAERVVLELFSGPSRLARTVVPGADPEGALMSLAIDRANPTLTWRNAVDSTPRVYHYGVTPTTIELVE
jgi:protein kinase-like protein